MTTDTINVSMRAGEAEVLIYNQIGNSFFEDGTTGKAFAESLRALGRVSVVNVRINSPGGALAEAQAIYSTLRNHGGRIITHNDGFALSSASLVLMAGDEIRMGESAWTMLHNPTLPARGDHTELARMAELLKGWTDSAAGIYAARTGQTKEQILQMMADETWLDATTAKAQGFATTITPALKVAAHFDPADFRNVPANLKGSAMPTVQEIRAACPGCDDKFIVTQMEAGATIAVAQTAWMANQQEEIATLKSRGPAAGVAPLPAGRSSAAPTAEYGDAIAMFNEAATLEMQSNPGLPINEARLRICRRDPELRKAYVEAHNAKHAARR